jgi:hypothetical protein
MSNVSTQRFPSCTAVPASGSGLVGSIENQVFDLVTTIPTFQLDLYLPARNFTAVLSYLDTPNFEILCAASVTIPPKADPSS